MSPWRSSMRVRPAFSRLARATDSMAWLASSPTARPRGASNCSMRPVPVPRSTRLRIGFGPRASSTAASTTASGAWRERTRSQSGAKAREEGLGRLRTLGADRAETRPIVEQLRIGAVEAVEHRAQDRAATPRSGEPEEGPGPSRCRSASPASTRSFR